MLHCGLFAHIVAAAALVGCGGEPLLLGGGGDSGCVPGTYAGTCDCGAGADASPLVPPSGTIVLSLEGDHGGKSLQIAPGSEFTGAQPGAIMFVTELSGSVDCATYKVTGAISRVRVVSGPQTFTITAQQLGDLSADYDASGPALVKGVLVNGIINAPGISPALLAGTATTCTWSAALQR
jgi:hypothetical protein